MPRQDTETFNDAREETLSGGDDQSMSISADLIRGHINTIILRCLYEEDMYGYDIINQIEKKSGNLYTLKQPTLYSALKRLESLKYVESYYGEFSNGGRRKYFRLTEEGKRVVQKNLAEWEYSRTIIDSLISDGDGHFDFSFITDKQSELNDLKKSLQAREEALEEEKKALSSLKNELQRERSLLSAQTSSLNNQKSDFNELKEKINTQREALAKQEQALVDKQSEIDAKEAELAQKQAELTRFKVQLDSQNTQIEVLQRQLEDSRAAEKSKAEELQDIDGALLALQRERTLLKEELALVKKNTEGKIDGIRLEQLQRSIADKDAEIDLKNSEITSLTATISTHEETITALHRELDGKNAAYYNKTLELQSKEAEISRQTSTLEEKRSDLNTRFQELEALKQSLQQREQDLAQKEALLEEMALQAKATGDNVNATLSSLEEKERELQAKTEALRRERELFAEEQLALQKLRESLQEKQERLDKLETETLQREMALEEKARALQAHFSQTDATNEQLSQQREELSAKQLEYIHESAQLKSEYELLRQQQRELDARQTLYNEQQLDFITRKNSLLAKEYEYTDKIGEYEAQMKRLQDNLARMEEERETFFAERRKQDEERTAFEKEKLAFEEEKYALEKERDSIKQAREEIEQKKLAQGDQLETQEAELERKARLLQERQYDLEQRERALKEATWEFDTRRKEAAIQTEIPQAQYPVAQEHISQEPPKPVSTPNLTDLKERAQAERIRLNTSGTLTVKPYAASTTDAGASIPTFNKGLTLFKAALLTFCIILAESLTVFFIKDTLNIPPWYAAIPFGIGFIFFGICAILYASGYKPQVRRQKHPAYFVNASIAFIVSIILVTMIAVYLKAELTLVTVLFAYVLIPVIFLANILLFAVFYYLFSKAKQTKK